MKRNTGKRAIIIILAVVLFVGVICTAILKSKSTADTANDANSFVLLSDGFTDRKIVDQASALAAIGDVADILGVGDVNAEFSNCQKKTVSGNTFYRFQQTYQGLPVYGRTVVVIADSEGCSLSLSGNYLPVGNISFDSIQTTEEIGVAVQTFIHENFDTNMYSADEATYNLLCIFCDENSDATYVVYRITANILGFGPYEFLVDAKDASVRKATSTLSTDYQLTNGTTTSIRADGQQKSQTIDVYEQDGMYIAADTTRNIELYRMNGSFFWFYSKNTNELSEVQWSTTQQPNDYQVEVDALAHIQTAYDYFDDVLSHKGPNGQGTTKTYIFTEWGFYSDAENVNGGDNLYDNAASDSDIEKNTTGICVGKTYKNEYALSANLDVMAHEYTHAVIKFACNLGGTDEADAINEACADIFGELTEIWESGNCDWMHNKRSIKDPQKNGYPAMLSDPGTGESDLAHGRSTIVSHAAYLMWNGIDGHGRFESLSAEDLANLFYETLYTLPSDCTFSEFRSLVQNMANIMHKQGRLSYEQTRTVSNAFFQVGILPATTPVVKDGLSIDVYDADGEPYFDYTLYVRYGSAEKTYSGEEVQAEGLNFPVLGEYELLVVDNANADNYTSVIVNVIEKGGVKRLPIFTNCGIKKWDGTLDGNTYPPTEDEKTPAVLLSNHPYNDHNSQFALSEYEVTGEIREKDGKYSTYTYLPNLPIIASMSGDFAHNGIITQLTIQKTTSRYDNAEYITINFDTPDGGGYHYGVKVGREWDGESVYCYMLHGKDNDYLILESLIPTSSSVGTDTYHMGRTDGTRTESIQIMDLTDFSSLTYTLNYNMEHDAFTIREDDSKESGWQYLYCQDGESYKYGSGYEQLYNSFDAAMEHVEERLSEYGLESRVEGSFAGDTLSAEIIPLFVAHRDGISQNYPIDSIDDMELVDVMILGVNPQLSEGTTEPPTSNFVDVFSLLGTWDSTDQEKRLHFKTTGLDIAYTKAGMINADGQVEMTDKTTGKERLASFILKSDSQIAIYLDLEEYIMDYSYDGHTLMLDGDRYVRADELLQDRIDGIIGTWICDDGSITFSENGTCRVKTNGSTITEGGTYSILDDNTLLINEPGRSPYEVDFVLNGDTLKVGKVSFKRSGESLGDVQSTKSAICDTWGHEESVMQYTFYDDGTYEARLSPAYSFSGVVLEDGTYEVRSSTEIYLYPDPTVAPQVIKYYPDQDTLEIFGGDFFTRCSDN